MLFKVMFRFNWLKSHCIILHTKKSPFTMFVFYIFISSCFNTHVVYYNDITQFYALMIIRLLYKR